MRRVLDQVARDFPGKPVKAAVSTSDAWPHIGGAPEVMARGIPVYHLDANGPILERLAQANGVEGELRPVSDAVTIDGDRNDIVLFPLGGLGSERMMAARIADAGLLYGSDTLQLDETGAPLSHARLYAYDLVKYSCERGLGTQRAFAMHAEPAAYAAIAEAVGYGSVEDCGG
jgi:hypothetical protein